MSELLLLKTFSDNRGNLSVLEDHEIPFPIRRLFYIYGVNDSQRGGHRHHTTYQALICLVGQCTVQVNNRGTQTNYRLSDPKWCLILEPDDWHILSGFTLGSILLVCASEYFDEQDYIYEPYENAIA